MATTEPRRVVSAKILTAAGWIEGGLHLPRVRGLLEHVEQSPGFLTVTDAWLPDREEPYPYFALQPRSAVLLLPAADPRLTQDAGAALQGREVAVQLDIVALRGTLAMLPGQRVSDRLGQLGDGWLRLDDVTIDPVGTSDLGGPSSAPVALVNTLRMVGVAEVEPAD